MLLEIERKFLIAGDYKPYAYNEIEITQGYLSSHPARSVRVRIAGDRAYLTIKGMGNEGGVSRLEWEKEIDRNEANQLIEICEAGVIEKTRYLIRYKNHLFEVDEFGGDNKGLVIAEIELESEDQSFEKPDWLGSEVTGIAKYYNAALSNNPFKNWK